MKALIPILIGLLVVGCATIPVKELTLEEKVVGEYEVKKEGDAFRLVLLKTGVVEEYRNGKKRHEAKWKIGKEDEVYLEDKNGIRGAVFMKLRINKDGSLTVSAYMPKDGELSDIPKDKQLNLKKIK